MAVLLLSDLHLPASRSPLRETFRQLLAGPARQAEAVYCLGDLFEYWVGDDVGLAAYGEEVRALAALTAAGVPVHFQHGNRDFLVGRRFAAVTGVTLMSDPQVVDLPGGPTLLSHGDPWCVDDVGYQRFRRFSRNRMAQALFLMMPVRWRQRVAGSLRQESHQHTRAKPADIMDVQPAAIRDAFLAHGVRRIIHGHTHRPAFHHSAEGERIVLPDWRAQRQDVLWVLNDGRCQVQAAKLTPPSGG